MNDRLPMPASMPAELAEKLSDQWHDYRASCTDTQLDDILLDMIRKDHSICDFTNPIEGWDYWSAKFRKALENAVLEETPQFYAELGRLVHHIARESVREE